MPSAIHEALVHLKARTSQRWRFVTCSTLSFRLGSTLRPLVLDPQQIPIVTDAAQVKAEPFLAVLSDVTHGRDQIETAIAVAAAPHVMRPGTRGR